MRLWFPGRTLVVTSQTAAHTDRKEDDDDPGDDEDRGSRAVREDLRHEGCREAQAARVEGLDGVPRPERGRPDLGDLRLGSGRLGELRLRSRGATDHAGGGPQGQAPGRRARRPVRRVSLIQENVAIVRRGYRALNSADPAPLAELLTTTPPGTRPGGARWRATPSAATPSSPGSDSTPGRRAGRSGPTSSASSPTRTAR